MGDVHRPSHAQQFRSNHRRFALKVKAKVKFDGWSIPKSCADSLRVPDAKEWALAREKEHKNFSDVCKSVWEECMRPDGRRVRILPTAEVHDLKLDKDGRPHKRKHRTCGKGFKQSEGIDHHDTHAPAIDPEIFRLCPVMALELDSSMEQFDFTAAFLAADSDVETCAELPPGHNPEMKGDVIPRLKKCIHGMKQSAARFHKRVSKDSEELGFKRSESGRCLHIKHHGSDVCLLTLHVDDGAHFTRDRRVIQKDLTLLRRKHRLESEPLNQHVGLRIDRTKDTISVSCDSCIDACAKRFGVEECAKVHTPIEKIPTKEDGSSSCVAEHTELIGCLIHVSNACRPDASCSVSMLASCMTNPSQESLLIGRCLLGHLFHSRERALTFRRQGVTGNSDGDEINNLLLEGFHDSDFAGDLEKRHSRSGCPICSGSSLTWWTSKLQSLMAQSVFEAETTAANGCHKALLFVRKILFDITGHPLRKGIPLHGDNEKSVECAQTGNHGKRSKHFDVRLHRLHQGHNDGVIATHHVETDQNPADLLTKVVKKNVFMSLVDKLVSVSVSKVLSLFVHV